MSHQGSKSTDDDQKFYDDLNKATSGKIPDGELTKANKALEDNSKSPQTVSQMIKGINALVAEGNLLDTRLLDVQHVVAKADLPSKLVAKTYRDAYTKLLWASRGIATSGKGAADDFAGDMMELIQDPEVPASEKITELKNWNTLTLSKGEAAINQPGHFKKFVTDLLAFGIRLEKEITTEDTTAKKEIAALVAEIARVNKEIEEIMDKVAAPIAKYLQLSQGVFKNLMSGSPEAALSALTAAISGVEEFLKFKDQLDAADKKRQKLEKERDGYNAQLRELEDKQAVLGDASTTPESIKSIGDEIKSFATKMTTFTDIFTQLSQEQAEIQKLLKEGKPVTDPVFASKLKLLKELLAVNSRVLGIYGSAPLSS